MKRLRGVETEEYALEVIECVCGFHLGLDVTYLLQVDDFVITCPSCGQEIDTAEVIPEEEK